MFKVPRVDEQVMNLKDIERLFNERRFKSSMESNIAHVLSRTGKKTSFLLTCDTSEIYTDGKKIVVGLPKECVGMKYGEIYSIVKASVGHESAHVKWSNFNAMKEYLEEVARRKINKSVGHSIFNIVEDGRIERLLCEELPGYTKHIKFLNLTLIRRDGKLRDGQDTLSYIINTILYLSVLGVYPTNYDDVLGKKERDLIDNEIYPLILKGVMTNSFSVVKNVCLEILDLIKGYIPRQMPMSLQQMLSELAQHSYNSSEGEDGEDASDLDERIKEIIKRQQSKNSSKKPSKQKDSDTEENGNNSDDKALNQDEVKSNEDDKQDESGKSSSSAMSDSSNPDEANEENDSNDASGSSGNNKEDIKEDAEGNDDGNSDTDSNAGDSESNEDGESNDSSNENNSDASSGSSGESDSDNSDKDGEDSSSEKDSKNNSSDANEDGDDQSDGNQKSDENNDLENENYSNPLPNHVGNTSGESDSLSYEDSEKDFFENLKEEIKEEAVRAFEKAEKEARRDKKNEKNAYHDSVDLKSINSNYSSQRQEPNFRFTYPHYPTSKPQPEFKMQIHGLRKTFEKILKNDEAHYKGQKRGRLDSSRLWRLGINDDSIFKKRNIEDKTDYAIEILIDVSGSMHDSSKYKNAMGTAICIEAALTGLEGVEVKTVAFNFDSGTKMRVLKDFKDTESKTPTVYNNWITGGCNRDGFAIRVALDDLKKHKAKNKLLIVISDGMPACDIENTEDSIADVKNAVHMGRKSATIVSILINNGRISDSTKQIFNHMYEEKGSIMVDVYNHPEDLMKNMVLYLKRMFKK